MIDLIKSKFDSPSPFSYNPVKNNWLVELNDNYLVDTFPYKLPVKYIKLRLNRKEKYKHWPDKILDLMVSPNKKNNIIDLLNTMLSSSSYVEHMDILRVK